MRSKDVAKLIAPYLSIKDLCQCRLVSKAWKNEWSDILWTRYLKCLKKMVLDQIYEAVDYKGPIEHALAMIAHWRTMYVPQLIDAVIPMDEHFVSLRKVMVWIIKLSYIKKLPPMVGAISVGCYSTVSFMCYFYNKESLVQPGLFKGGIAIIKAAIHYGNNRILLYLTRSVFKDIMGVNMDILRAVFGLERYRKGLETPFHILSVHYNPCSFSADVPRWLAYSITFQDRPLFYAVIEWMTASCEANGIIDTRIRWTVLHHACQERFQEAVAYIMPKIIGTEHPQEKVYGRTPLHIAVLQGDVDFLKVLVPRLNMKNPLDWNRGSAMHYAATLANSDVLEYLFQFAPEGVDSVDNFGYTPLHMAVGMGREACVRFLLGKVKNVNARTNQGLLPSDLAPKEFLKTFLALTLESLQSSKIQ